MRYKLLTMIAAALTVSMLFCACSKKDGGDQPSPTQEASADDSTSADAAEVPEELKQYMLGENGSYSDEYLTANFPSFMQFRRLNNYGNPLYSGKKGDQKYALSYVADKSCDYNVMFAQQDFDSFSEYLIESLISTCVLDEFEPILIDGHNATKIRYHFPDPQAPEITVRTVQYCIDVEGWVLSITIGTQGDTIDEECFSFIDTIRFK